MFASQAPLDYPNARVDALFAGLNAQRMQPFLREAKGEAGLALRLYAWNGRLADALRFPLELAECITRERIAGALVARYGQQWHVDAQFLNDLEPDANAKLQKTVAERTRATGRPPAAGSELVHHLTFGFWGYLFTVRFVSQLWLKRIKVAFPHLAPGLNDQDAATKVHTSLKVLVALRNRVAHHDPVWSPSPNEQQKYIEDYIALACPHMAEWARYHATVAPILRAKPKSRIAARVADFLQPGPPSLTGGSKLSDALAVMRQSPNRSVLARVGSPPTERDVVLVPEDIVDLLSSDANLELGLVDLSTKLEDAFPWLTGRSTAVLATESPSRAVGRFVQAGNNQGVHRHAAVVVERKSSSVGLGSVSMCALLGDGFALPPMG